VKAIGWKIDFAALEAMDFAPWDVERAVPRLDVARCRFQPPSLKKSLALQPHL
jgi:hypothetical protein